ncbi:hypothetical protein H261_17578 [Paramagnetospirillum caucaseum]|uniref:EF-hand domain-containing protein n=1 Tax=Paramagnetospirillum caucaseum TaxID=1244869 RepID=M2Y6A9_9PROT|nr:EF-hand domain-containing protein [Paramagnetospirillum caucaseum]EME68586.1 hypothetical protein H261_17578 [Paramagnetospirillum caucaseum]
MLHGPDASASSSTYNISSVFKRIDTNSDSSVDRAEFIAGKPDDVSEEQAGALFDRLDSSGTGALSQDSLTAAVQQIAASMQSVLLQSQEIGQGNRPGGPPDPEQMIEDLDSDGDGTVSRDEFVAGRPDGVGEEQADTFYDKIAAAAGADSASGLSQEQLAAGMKAAGPPERTASGQTTATATRSAGGELLQEMLKAIGSYQKASLLGAAA